ncbi:unnamed protein product [Triticum turgidum subsp. durum]|uniref:Uncharacterized protein n=1 Tax=Triticum turgidum subsp. durum TaxID=4567 RepID=A0A9R0Z358_TRITD|nr:unnamed protein product [Triticum turgidum subsp. durum]
MREREKEGEEHRWWFEHCRLHPRTIFVTRSRLLPHPSSSRTATEASPVRLVVFHSVEELSMLKIFSRIIGSLNMKDSLMCQSQLGEAFLDSWLTTTITTR